MASLRHGLEEPGDEQDIRLVVDTIPTLAWSAGPDGSADFFNQRWLDYTGLSAEQALGSGWQVAIHPHDLNDLVDYWRRVVASGQPDEIEGRLRRSDGVYGWFLFRATPSLDENGRVVKWYGTNTDIDDRKRAEQVLAVQNTRLQLLLQLTKRITSNLELREVLRSVSATVRKAMHADAAGVAFFDEVSDKCRIYALDFPDAKGFVKEEIVVTPGLAFKRAWESSKPVIVNTNDPEELGPEIYALVVAEDLNGHCLIPLVSRGRTVGVLIVARKLEGSFTSEDVDFLSEASGQIAIAIENCLAYGEIVELKEKLAQVVDTIPTLAWSAGPDGSADFFNQRWLDYTGVSAKQALGSGWEVAIHPDDLPRMLERFRQALNSVRPLEVEGRFRRFDGEFRWFLFRASPLCDECGKVVKWYGTNTDIEDRKRAEDALRSHEQNLRLLVDTIPGHVVTTTPAGEIELLNRRVLEYFDKTPEELANWQTSDAIHPDDLLLTIAALTRSTQTGEPYEVEHRLRRADGAYRWFHTRGLALRDKEGRIVRWYYLPIDVDDRRRAEEALRKSEALLHEAQRLARTGSWSWDVSSGKVVTSPENARIYGFQPNEDTAAPEPYFQRIHPDHRERVREVFQTCVVEKTDYQADFPIVLLDGTVKYIHVTGHPILNKSGELIEFFGTTVDVTEQHEARAALQTAFEQLKAEETELRRMTDAIATYICVLRPDGTALYANQTVLDYTGLTLEDVQREDLPARIFHPEDVERLLEKRHEALARGKPFELEQRELGKDGKYRWFLVRYNPLRDDQGHIIRWYATGTDIEDRKQAEERVRDENLALREEIDQAFMFEDIVGSSPALQTVLSSIVKVAPTDSTVLITGETGTGKELIARAIHKHSQRSGQAFISVNCASIPSSLIASELFGHERGAFTGAVQRRQGRFELAHSGTIFLDEVGELPAETQIALLRVLQERQFERVGGNRIIPTDVRVIAATNRDLMAAIAAGTFRADLFYRLNVFPIEVPPLRKRKEDIPMLVEYFVKRYAEKARKHICKIDNNSLERCQSYAWPGNIRELQNIIERSVILSSGDTFWIEKAWLASVQPPRQELAGPLTNALQNQERDIIESALAECKGKVAGPEGAAARLGIPRSTLDSKIKQLKIKKHKFISE